MIGPLEEIIRSIEAGSRRLQELDGIDASRLIGSYGPGKWSGLEILTHIADADLIYLTRFLRIAAGENGAIQTFDENLWVVELEAGKRPPDVSIALSVSVRRTFVDGLSRLPEAALTRTAFHPERGEMNAVAMARSAAEHALHHLEQIDAILAGRTWPA